MRYIGLNWDVRYALECIYNSAQDGIRLLDEDEYKNEDDDWIIVEELLREYVMFAKVMIVEEIYVSRMVCQDSLA